MQVSRLEIDQRLSAYKSDEWESYQPNFYLVVVDGFQKTRHVETGQSHQFRSAFNCGEQQSDHTVRMEEGQQTDVSLLVGCC